MTNITPAQIEAVNAPLWPDDETPWIAALVAADGTVVRRSDYHATEEAARAELEDLCQPAS